MLNEVLDRVLGFRRPKYPLNLEPSPISEMATPSVLSITLSSSQGFPWLPRVKEGDQVHPGQFLGSDGSRPVAVCPAKGKVIGVISAPDLRGARTGEAVLIEPAEDSSPGVFTGMDPAAAPDKLWARIEEAGLVTDAQSPRPLAEVIGGRAGIKVRTLIVSAVDREPVQCSALQSFRERSDDACLAAAMLGRMSGAESVMLAVPAPLAADAGKVCDRHQVRVLSIPAFYPEGLEPLLALRAGSEGVRVVAVETALNALDAVREGKAPDSKVITFIGPAGKARANYRVRLGARLKDVFAAAGLKPRDGDKVIAGGAMRGYAQFSLDAAIDAGVDAVTMIPSESIVAWSDEPCVNSGSCIAVCPVKLQPNLLGRYAEFGLFDRTEDLGVLNCVECGLCASVCTARRPLLQWIRLAKAHVLEQQAARKVMETGACEEQDGEEAAASQ